MYVFYLGAAIRPSGCHAATQLRRSMVFQGYWGVDFVARITNVQSSVPLVAQTPLVSSIVLPSILDTPTMTLRLSHGSAPFNGFPGLPPCTR